MTKEQEDITLKHHYHMDEFRKIIKFHHHMHRFRSILKHRDPSLTANWFFKNIDDAVICSPFDMYMTHGYSAVKYMIENDDPIAYIRKFYPEYLKDHQEIVPVVMGDGTVRLVLKS